MNIVFALLCLFGPALLVTAVIGLGIMLGDKPLCWLGQHRCKMNSDDDGVWGECVGCGEKYGYVARDVLRSYIDREVELEKAKPRWKE